MRSSATRDVIARRRFVAACLAAAAGGLCLRAAPAAARALKLGAVAPPATLVTLDGERITTAALRGDVVILTFWATWCVPCRDELPLLSEYALRHAADGLRVLGFSLDGPERRAEARAVGAALGFPVGLLAESDAAGYGRIWRLPVSFVIGRDGRLADNGWDHKDAVWTGPRLEAIVTPLLAAAAAAQ